MEEITLEETLIVYTVYSYEDSEIKGIFKSKESAQEWVTENRKDNEYDCHIEDWFVEGVSE